MSNLKNSFLTGSMGMLSVIQPLLSDNQVSEILINQPKEIWVEKSGELTRETISEFTELYLDRLFMLIASENKQVLSAQKPLLSGSLPDGSRVQLVMPPTGKFHALSIRRKVMKDLGLGDYEKNNYYSEAKAAHIKELSLNELPVEEQGLVYLYKTENWPDFIRLAIKLKKNIVISGGTSSGKTTFLNACLKEIDLNDRIIVLEDTREIEIPHLNKVQLLASKGEQGQAKINMQDLVQCCLRLRPDRIIMGEIRGGEIMDFISASSTGHEGSLTSIHANNPRIAFMRMCQMYKLNNVPSMSDEDIMRELKEIIDVIIQIHKTPKGRKVQSVYYKYGELANGFAEHL